MKLLGEYSAPKLYDAGEKFLDGFNKGAGCLFVEREQHAADRQAWADEKAEILNRMALLEQSIEALKQQHGHAGPAAPQRF